MINSPLIYQGRAKYPFTADSDWDNATPPDAPEPREASGWTYGNANWAYNADGTAKTVSKATLEENGAGLRFYFGTNGAALYSTDQTTYDARIKRVLRVENLTGWKDESGNVYGDESGVWSDE